MSSAYDSLSSYSGGGMSTLQGLGNLKGVLLSQRPPTRGAHLPNGPFIPSGRVREVNGLAPSYESHNDNSVAKTSLEERKTTNIISKHKQYIKQLENEQRELRKQEEDREKTEKQRQDRLAQQQAALRDIIRGVSSSSLDDDAPKPSLPSPPIPPPSPSARKPHTASKKKRAKPAWAKTEAESNKVEDDMDAEADELLEFTHSLDYGRFLDDYNIDDALEQIRQKVLELESSKEADEQRRQDVLPDEEEDGEAEAGAGDAEQQGKRERRLEAAFGDAARPSSSSASHRPPVRAGKGGELLAKLLGAKLDSKSNPRESWDGSIGPAAARQSARSYSIDSLKAAERILVTLQKLGSVHSKASLAAMVEELSQRTKNLRDLQRKEKGNGNGPSVSSVPFASEPSPSHLSLLARLAGQTPTPPGIPPSATVHFQPHSSFSASSSLAGSAAPSRSASTIPVEPVVSAPSAAITFGQTAIPPLALPQAGPASLQTFSNPNKVLQIAQPQERVLINIIKDPQSHASRLPYLYRNPSI